MSRGEATVVIPVTTRAAKRRQASGASMTTVASEPTGGPSSATTDDGRAKGRCRTRGEIPGDTGDAQAVGPVRLDLELVDDVGDEAEVLGDRRAEGESRREVPVGGPGRSQDEQSRGVGAQAELGRRAQHPVRRHAAHLAAGDLDPAGEHGPDGRERHDVADDVVPGAADDLDGLVATGVDEGEADAVGAGDRPDLDDAGHDDTGEAAPDVLDRLDDETEGVQLGTERGDTLGVGRVDAEGRELAQPGKRYPHAAPYPVLSDDPACGTQNPARKRTSFSMKARMSSIP